MREGKKFCVQKIKLIVLF